LFTMCKKTSSRQIEWQLEWNHVYTLPSPHQHEQNKGVAGAFSGFVGSELIIAGGANFPDKMPWEGGTKNWEKTLYHFDTEKTDSQGGIVTGFLPNSVAYGVSVQLPEGVLCIGGNDSQQCFNEVFLICKENGRFRLSYDWPPLPVPLANATGALLDNKIYIAGGQEKMVEENATNHFFVLDLDNKEKGWVVLPSWEGSARGYAVSVACDDGENPGFYLFSGRDYHSTGYIEVLTDGHRYNPYQNSWTQLQDTFPVMAGTAFSLAEHIVFLGGVTKLMPGSYEHPGFENCLRVYDTGSQTFILEEPLPFSVPVTTNIARRKNSIYITSGEVRPGIRTPDIYEGHIIPLKK